LLSKAKLKLDYYAIDQLDALASEIYAGQQ